jgi:hypothetical protein
MRLHSWDKKELTIWRKDGPHRSLGEAGDAAARARARADPHSGEAAAAKTNVPQQTTISPASFDGRRTLAFSVLSTLPPPAQDFRGCADLVNGIAAMTPDGSAELVFQAAKEEKRREGGEEGSEEEVVVTVVALELVVAWEAVASGVVVAVGLVKN